MKNAIFITLILISFNGFCQNNNSLNNISISKILLPKDNNSTFTLTLSKSSGIYTYRYENIEISIIYYNKNNVYKLNDEPYTISHIKIFEQYNSGLINEMSGFAWNQNIRLNNYNGFKYGDSFIFSAHDFVYKQLRRMLYLSTNNFYIGIVIEPYSTDHQKEIFNAIYREAPQYFEKITMGEMRQEFITWDFKNKGAIKFGNDLLTGSNNSNTANLWYNKSEEIINKIYYR